MHPLTQPMFPFTSPTCPFFYQCIQPRLTSVPFHLPVHPFTCPCISTASVGLLASVPVLSTSCAKTNFSVNWPAKLLSVTFLTKTSNSYCVVYNKFVVLVKTAKNTQAFLACLLCLFCWYTSTCFCLHCRISICTEHMDGWWLSHVVDWLPWQHHQYVRVCVCLSLGGSLDTYGSIPEPVLGRVAIAVGHCFEVFVCVCVVARCVVLFANAGSEGLKLLVEFEDHAQRLFLPPPVPFLSLLPHLLSLSLSSSFLLALCPPLCCVHD